MATRPARNFPARRAKRHDGRGAHSMSAFVLAVAAIAWMVRSLILQPFYIPSASMLPTLEVGDYILVAKWPYGYSRYSFPFALPSFTDRLAARLPHRGDIIVFRHPTQNSDLIKRVIALPGDSVEVRRGHLILNGHLVEQRPIGNSNVPISPNTPCHVVPGAVSIITLSTKVKACSYRAFEEILPGGARYTVLDQLDSGDGDEFPETLVPPGHVFVLGDNRDDSLDSRFGVHDGGVGMLPVENLVGRSLVIFWSTDGSAKIAKPWTWFTALRHGRIGNAFSGSAR